MTAAFAGIPTSDGTWTLSVGDGAAGDTGAVSASNLTLTAPAVTVPGTGTGDIPDDNLANPLVISFEVTGIGGAPTDVSVDMDATHTWVGDIDATLASPDGTTHDIIINTGGPGFGDSSNLGGVYNFSDAAAGDWWAEAGNGTSDYVMAAGDYRTVSITGAATDMTAAFAGIPTSNGTWTLSVGDGAAGDTGAVSAANLTLVGGGVAPAPGSTFVDMDGDGQTDHVVGRAAGLPSLTDIGIGTRAGSYRERLAMETKDGSDQLGADGIDWWTYNSSDDSSLTTPFGAANTDFFTPADFDGDGKTDISVWRSGAANVAEFRILRSSDSTITTDTFGQTGDDPLIVGDYDGDGMADPAVFRCPGSAGQCTFYYRGSAGGGGITFVPWGNGTASTLFANPGDFDGDGKYDFCLQRTNPDIAGGGQFVLLRSSDNGVEFVNWGLNTDLIAPGDYDGDGQTDFAVGRNEGGSRVWYVLERDGGAFQSPFGLSSDFMTPGDYDGDGATDLGVWRPSTGTFWCPGSFFESKPGRRFECTRPAYFKNRFSRQPLTSGRPQVRNKIINFSVGR
jgi:subtilisin-like proprotein convertase family protein